MRVAAPVLCAALLLAGGSGCASAPPSPSSESVVAGMSAFETEIESMPGVESVLLDTSSSGDQVNLRVTIAEGATIDEAEDIGVAAAGMRTEPLPPGVYPGRIELRHGESLYAHFAVATDDVLRAQVGYWMGVADSGVESVTVRTFSSSIDGAGATVTPQSTSNVPVLLNAPAGRFVGVTMPDVGLDELRTIVSQIRAIPDPGANVGEWQLVTSDGATKAEFASPRLPSVDQVEFAGTIAETVARLDDGATLSVRFDDSGGTPSVAAELTAFDESLENQRGPAFEQALRDSAIWPAVLDLVTELDASGGDFSLRVLSNALEVSGNFVLAVSVSDCVFARDTAWPALSDELGAHWMKEHGARFPGQSGCRVS